MTSENDNISESEYRAVLSDGDEDEDLSVTERLLKYSRNGEDAKVSNLLLSPSHEPCASFINCKGNTKANRDWTPLHLASYFGHLSTVELLIQHGADVNAINDKGDTPLHKAAYTGRLDLVTLLLKSSADVNTMNVEGKTPIKLAKTTETYEIIEAAQRTESSVNEKQFMKLVREGNIVELEAMIKQCKGLKINCVDDHGNTALHLAALRDRQQMAAFLMQAGVRSDITNENNELPADLASSAGMKQVLSLTPLSDLCKTVTRFEGQLHKKTRVFGYKPKYVVLDRGVLTIFSTLADASSGAKRRTYKYLDDAQCLIQSKDNLGVAVVYNNGSTHLFRVESDSQENISRQKWVNAMRSHIAYSTYYMHKGLDASDEFEDLLPISSMSDALQTAQAHQTSLEKEVGLLSVAAASLTTANSAGHKQGFQDAITKCNNIASSSRDMYTVLQHCLTLFTQQEQLLSEQLSEEREKCRVLQESLRVLAVQHYELEQQIETSGAYTVSSVEDIDAMSSSVHSSDDEFYECDVNEEDDYTQPQLDSNMNGSFTQSCEAGPSAKCTDLQKLRAIHKHVALGREELPVPMLSKNEFSVWSILKQCIGKELSKITMPVVFNEPISFLQRITEYMEYSYLLDRATVCESAAERMANIAAFAVSACASNWDRLGKPFNPLLGETYELNKEELGYKVVCEQVSHHPPISAFHVSTADYKVYGAINSKLKFWGKAVEINPKGVITVELLRHGEVYTWENVNLSVHNIIVGKLWLEHHGRMEIVNHKTGHRADITFKKSNMFSKEVHKVEGTILDSKDNRLLMLYGSWTDAMFSLSPTRWDDFLKQDKPKSRPGLDTMKSIGKSLSLDTNDSSSEVPLKPSNYDLKISGQTFLWQADSRPANCDKYYSFTRFAMMLNELDESTKNKLAPTDSRLRPDIRFLENGDIDQAAEKKIYLEEKQRNTRKEMKKNKEEWSPRWFSYSPHPVTSKQDWIYQGQYWNSDWTKCPDIF